MIAESHALKDQLVQLGLRAMANQFEAEAERAAQSETPYTTYLARLVEAELADKTDRSVNARVHRARFPHDADFLEGLQLQHTHNPAEHLRGVMELVSLYDERSMRRTFALAREYKTYSHAFIRGLLESRAVPQIVDPEGAGSPASPGPRTEVHGDLRPYQQLLWEAGR